MQSLLDDVESCTKKLDRPLPVVCEWQDISESQREWIIPNWLPANTVTMLTGQGGAGKSWLTLQALCQIACGFPDAYLNPDYEIRKKADYDDSEASESKHIIFATYEDEPAEIKRRLHALASGFQWIQTSLEKIKKHIHIVDMRSVGSVWGPGIGTHISVMGDLLPAGEAIRYLSEQKEARLLVIDPLSGAFGGNENDRTAVYDFVSSFRGWCDAVGCAILIIGHLPKSPEGRAAGFSGSTAWEASVRCMWMLTKVSESEKKKGDEKNYWALHHTKSNYARLQAEIPLRKNQNGWWSQAENKEDAKAAFQEYQNTQEADDAKTDIPDF